MLGSSILLSVFDSVIKTGLVKSVYHSAILQQLPSGDTRPVIPTNGKYIPVGIEDSKGFHCYCRQFEDAVVISSVKISFSIKEYTLKIPQRLVFFHNREKRSHEQLTSIITQAVIGSQHTNLLKIHTLRDLLLRLEQPGGRFTFTELTYYTAIDFYIILNLQATNCPTDIKCEGINNPY